GRVDDPSLIRIHRLKYNRSSVSLYLMSNVLCKMFQRLFSSCTIVLCIQLHSHIACLVLVSHTVCQILKCVQCLSSFSDQDSHVVTFHVNTEGAVFIN